MANSLYVTALGPASGKSLAVLGVAELLSHRVQRLGFFRPVVRGGEKPDNDIELVRRHYGLPQSYEDSFACTYDEAQRLVSDGHRDRLLKRILARYRELLNRCDFVICEGTDYTGIAAAFEFEFNAEIANHLGCPVVIVANARQQTPEMLAGTVQAGRNAFVEQRCSVVVTFVNRVSPDQIDATAEVFSKQWQYEDPIFLIPEQPILKSPTIRELADGLGAGVLFGTPESLNREALNFRIAAMQLTNFLDYVIDGSLIIVPGDRADIVLGALATVASNKFPKIAGIVLTGGIPLAPQIVRLLEGISRPPVPIIAVDTDTYTTSMRINSIRAAIDADNQPKIASALGTFESHVDLAALEQRIEVSRSTSVTPLMFEYQLIERAKANRQHIVLPEGNEERILRASEILLRRGVVDLTLLGAEHEIRAHIMELGLELSKIRIVDPARSEWRADFARTFFELRKNKGVTEETAFDTVLDVSYFGTLMVYAGLADGMVSGSIHTTAHTIRPALQIIKTQPGCSIVSSVFFMCLADRVLVYGDCAINPNPDPQQLADIAVSAADTARMFDVEPRIAMLSYSTGVSGHGEDVDRVKEATRIARQMRPDLPIEGPIQYDAAIDASVARTKLPDSQVAGRATVFIFPDLNTGNNTYKAVQRSAGAVAVGPVLQGLKKPVNDLSRGCTVPDIVNTVAITAIQAQTIETDP